MIELNNKKTPKLTIVGAGPGDVELITLKAIKADYDEIMQNYYTKKD